MLWDTILDINRDGNRRIFEHFEDVVTEIPKITVMNYRRIKVGKANVTFPEYSPLWIDAIQLGFPDCFAFGDRGEPIITPFESF